MNVFPEGLPAPLVAGYGATLRAGLSRTEMSGGASRSRRLFATLPQVYRVTWRLARAQRAELVAFFDEIGVAEFWCPLRVPGDPRAARSVRARLADDLSVVAIAPGHDDVAAILSVDRVEVVIDFGGLLTPGGDDALAPDGSAAQWEVLG